MAPRAWRLDVVHIPGSLNRDADDLSRGRWRLFEMRTPGAMRIHVEVPRCYVDMLQVEAVGRSLSAPSAQHMSPSSTTAVV